jgi:hypothetical protein
MCERFASCLRTRGGKSPAKYRIREGSAARSHVVLRQTVSPHRRITVPDHKEVAKGTLRAIIRQADLTVDEFKALL